jgi:fucose 4-O-acetylase-like acetyltransferase
MKILTHPAFSALGAATLCLLILVAPLVSPMHLEIYHLDGSPSSIFGPVLIVLCAAWLILAILLWLARKPGWLYTTI